MVAFVAIDFETADFGRDSACAVGLVRVEGARIVGRTERLIRPPRSAFSFTHVHGIRWRDVADQPPFAAIWGELASMLAGARFLAAHNAAFDRSVLGRCCAAARIPAPDLPWVCTLSLARRLWRLRPASLPAVCRHLSIPLQHHRAASDAEACARIVLAAGAAVLPAPGKREPGSRTRRGAAQW